MSDGITFTTKLQFAAVVLCLMPVMMLCAVFLAWRRRIAAAAVNAQTDSLLRPSVLSLGMVMASFLPVMLTVCVMLPDINVLSSVGMGSVAGAAAMMTVTPGLAVVLALAVVPYAVAGMPAPCEFRFDSHVVALVRSWSAPQWMPRWARFALPDTRI